MTSRSSRGVELVGGIYDGQYMELPQPCSCCGWPVERATGGAITAPSGAVYVIEPGVARAVYIGDGAQLTLDELLSGSGE
jgi:hypothetical protein